MKATLTAMAVLVLLGAGVSAAGGSGTQVPDAPAWACVAAPGQPAVGRPEPASTSEDCILWTGSQEDWCQAYADPGCNPCPTTTANKVGYGDDPSHTRVCTWLGATNEQAGAVSIQWSAIEDYVWVFDLIDSDIDNDAFYDDGEVFDGSNPTSSQSTPLSDDDGDGTPNNKEFQNLVHPTTNVALGNLCSGAIGVQAFPACLPNTLPAYGSPFIPYTNTGGWVRQHNGTYYAWDGVCMPPKPDYARCAASSTYDWPPQLCDNLTAPCKSRYWSEQDGYGWAEIGTSLQVPLPHQGKPVVDEDEDLVPTLALCPTRIDVSGAGPTVAEQNTDNCTALGDPDDNDATQPNAQGPFIQEWHDYAEGQAAHAGDVDRDGSLNVNETRAGSHFNDEGSTPTSDDDGDGTPNQEEPATLGLEANRGLCTGAYGLVQSSTCGGYPGATSTAGCTSPQGYHFVCRSGSNVWLWDPLCTLASDDRVDYAACKASTMRTRTTNPYNGDYAGDGYGWRYASNGVTNVEVLPVPRGSNPVADADGDGFPVLWMCKRTVTVTITGSYTVGGEQDCASTSIDPDDGNTTVPVDRNYPVRTAEAVLADLESYFAPVRDATAAYVNQTTNQVRSYVNGSVQQLMAALDAVNSTAAGAEGLVAVLYTQLVQLSQNTTQAVLSDLALAQQILDQAATCLQGSTATYVATMQDEALQFIADGSQSGLDAMRGAIQAASAQWQGEAVECYNDEDLGPLANGAIDLAIQVALHAANQALVVLDYSRQATQDTADFLASMNSTVPAVTQGMADAIIATSNATAQFVATMHALVEAYVAAFDPRSILDDDLNERNPPTSTSSTTTAPSNQSTPRKSWPRIPVVAVGTGTVVLAAVWFLGRR